MQLKKCKSIRGGDRLFVAMPCHRESDGSYRDIIHPIGQSARRVLEDAVINAYRTCVSGQEISEAET